MKGYFAGAAGAAAGTAGAAAGTAGAAAGAAFLATFLAFFTVLAGASAAFSAGAAGAGAAFSWATATPSESANIIAVRIATIFFIQYHLRSFNGIYRRFFDILTNRKQK
jgi:hypothetical protein